MVRIYDALVGRPFRAAYYYARRYGRANESIIHGSSSLTPSTAFGRSTKVGATRGGAFWVVGGGRVVHSNALANLPGRIFEC